MIAVWVIYPFDKQRFESGVFEAEAQADEFVANLKAEFDGHLDITYDEYPTKELCLYAIQYAKQSQQDNFGFVFIDRKPQASISQEEKCMSKLQDQHPWLMPGLLSTLDCMAKVADWAEGNSALSMAEVSAQIQVAWVTLDATINQIKRQENDETTS